MPTTSKGKEQAANKRVDLRYGASTSAITLDDPSDINEKSETGGKLRRRVQKVFKKDKNEREQSEKHIRDEDNRIVDDKGKKAEAELEDATGTANGTEDEDMTAENGDDAPPTYSESVNEFLLDPMQQFSAFPPVTLRKAQIEFRQSLRLATNLLSQQQNFSSMCSTAVRKVQSGNELELKP